MRNFVKSDWRWLFFILSSCALHYSTEVTPKQGVSICVCGGGGGKWLMGKRNGSGNMTHHPPKSAFPGMRVLLGSGHQPPKASWLVPAMFCCSFWVVSDSLQRMAYSTPGSPVLYQLLEFAQAELVQLLRRVQLFATPWATAHQASLSFTVSWCLFKLMSTESVMPSNHLILCRPLLLLLSIFPSIRVLSNESALCIRWPKNWSFSVSPSN